MRTVCVLEYLKSWFIAKAPNQSFQPTRYSALRAPALAAELVR
jgi:hypothetical protein